MSSIDEVANVHTLTIEERNGDYNPVELAWCSYMNLEEYNKAIEDYPHLEEEMRKFTTLEGNKMILQYARIMADDRRFYTDMEKYEIYSGRVDYDTFERIILSRYENYKDDVGIFECSILQNSIETMMLYYEMKDEEIIAFYRKVAAAMQERQMMLLYLDGENVRENILQIKKERCDENGVEMWFPLMMEFNKSCPYGKHHHYQDIEDLIEHLQRRRKLEHRILKECFSTCFRMLPSKEYNLDDVIKWCRS